VIIRYHPKSKFWSNEYTHADGFKIKTEGFKNHIEAQEDIKKKFKGVEIEIIYK
jgi:hypothetical protein